MGSYFEIHGNLYEPFDPLSLNNEVLNQTDKI